MKKIGTILTFLICMGVSSLWGQNIQIRGIVTDATDGSSLPGVVITVKGTNTVSTTLNDGTYSLTAPSNATLVFSFIGMTVQEVPVGNRTVINVEMSSDITLAEVVVTAMGMTRERKSLGYAVQEIKSEDLTRASATGIATAMQGKLSGVDVRPSSGMPGASAQVVIRGARSFTGNNTPLYVVDGMPIASTPTWGAGAGTQGTDYTTRAMDIDPNDIETFTVLKGQAASALYGLRASNGAIIITTKSGKNAKGKPVITVSSSVTFDQVARKPDYQTTYAQGGWDVAQGRYAYQWQGASAWGPKITELPNEPTLIPAGSEFSGPIGGNLNGRPGKYYVHQRWQAGLDPWVEPAIYDNFGDYFQIGATFNNAINVSQATDRTSYSFGIAAANQEGIVPSSAMNRYTARGLVETQLSKAWKTGFSANLSHTYVSMITSANDGMLWALYAAPANYDLKGIPAATDANPYSQILFRSATFNNPYWAQEHNTNDENTTRVFGNAFLQFSPEISFDGSKTLSFRYQLGIDTYTSQRQNIEEFGSRTGTGVVEHRSYQIRNLNSLLTANFNMNFANDFDFGLMLGNEIVHDKDNFYFLQGTVLNYGGFPHFSNTNVRNGSESKTQNRTVGFFANASLSYKSMLFLNVTGRNDVVSSMPRNNRSFFYPSASLGFVFTELNALRGNSFLSFGKLRGSIAEVGMAGTYQENSYVAPGYAGGFWSTAPNQYPIAGVNSYILGNTMYDPNLKPQNTRSYEIGVDLRFLQNRIGVEYTYSYQDTKDQIFGVPLAGSTGKGTMMMNGGRMTAKTHEASLLLVPVQRRDLRVATQFNFTKIDNFVLELAPGVENISLGGFVTPQVRAYAGYKYPVLFGEIYLRDSQGRVLVEDNEFLPNGTRNPNYGFPMSGAMDGLGEASPNFNLGNVTTISYKFLTLQGVFEWKQGGYMYSGTNGLMRSSNGLDKTTLSREGTFMWDGYKSNGQKNDIVRGGPGDERAHVDLAGRLGGIPEFFIFESSFVKLREVSLSAKLPKIYKTFDVTASVFARNILLWTTYPNLDPESSQGNNNMGGTFERFSVPNTKSLGVSLNIVF
ncbi:MAG: SusC/RagA family TonB-linked outer membrane protein [Bacteroidales bacterium]|nr:SusC/RagA family TonB-linked outer membrane protein [Bacteroidales bacterium]